MIFIPCAKTVCIPYVLSSELRNTFDVDYHPSARIPLVVCLFSRIGPLRGKLMISPSQESRFATNAVNIQPCRNHRGHISPATPSKRHSVYSGNAAAP